jgi:VanZ family protein
MNQPNQTPLPLVFMIAYLGFIVYGSLVPLEYTPLTIEFAWKKFQQTEMLQLGIESRADWVANGILYIPAGFLVAQCFIAHAPRIFRLPAMFLAFLICASFAFGIEFTQIFFPPRTVSQNDILAECIGSLVGIALAPFFGQWVRQILDEITATNEAGTSRLLVAYLIAYIAYSLFPFDFVLSPAELFAKINSDDLGILLAGNNVDSKIFLQLVKFAIEVATAIPFGIFFIRRVQAGASSPASALLPGAALGLAIEVAQIFIYSGLSQGASVLSRAIGCYAGAFLWLHRNNLSQLQVRTFLKRKSYLLLSLYLISLAALAGWFSHRWQSLDVALAAFGKVHLLPFYYHYYTSEAVALTSLLSNAAMFAPVGMFAWAWNRRGFTAALLAGFFALILETSRLFFLDTHADPTNVLIAAISAWGLTTLIEKLSSSTQTKSDADTNSKSLTTNVPERFSTTAPNQYTSVKWLALISATGFTLFWSMDFPAHPLILLVGLLACAAATWVMPILIIALIPAALPILDLAPWSGRFFLDEFDILLMVTLAVGYVRTKPAPLSDSDGKLFSWTLGLLALSYAISTTRAMLPLTEIDASSFTSYFSPYNALRISKGLILALLFIGLYRRLTHNTNNAFHWFAWGTCLGLAITVALIASEKALFGGLLNFDSEYRATGPFSAIPIGGAFIEAYLVIAVPFLIFLTIRTENWLQRIAGSTLLLATTYALMITVSRNGFVAYTVTFAVALLSTLAGGGSKLRRLRMVVVLALAAVAVAAPIFKGDFAQQRMAQVANDLGVRTTHWRNGLAMRQDDWLTELFGMGIGRYPATHYWSSRDNIHTSVHIPVTEGGNTFLRIIPGNTVYVEQIVDIAPQKDYFLSFDLRSSTLNPKAGIALCEKSMLTTLQCATWQGGPLTVEAKNKWTRFEIKIKSTELGTGSLLTQRPAKLSFFTSGNETLDIDNIKLTSISGNELIINGDFSKNMDRWFFSTDEHLAWHIKNLPVSVLFDQGWFGLLAFSLFLATAGIKSARLAFAGNVEPGIALAALVGFLVVGIFDTLIDAPRFLFLLVVLATLAGSLAQPKSRTIRQNPLETVSGDK